MAIARMPKRRRNVSKWLPPAYPSLKLMISWLSAGIDQPAANQAVTNKFELK